MKAGDIAPDFSLPSTEDESVHLYSVLESSPVVLFFYLKAFTPLCVSEVCTFQSELPSFIAAGARVFGISSDSETLARQFKRAMKLDFPLLIDKNGTVRQAFNVPRLLLVVPGRSTYVISRDRRISGVTHANGSGRVHIQESLQFLNG